MILYRYVIIGVAGLLLASTAIGHGEDVPGHLTRDIVVGANHDVPLKAGQAVQIMKKSGANVVIMVPLVDGSQGIFQVDGAAVQVDAPTPAPTPVMPVASSPPPVPTKTTAPAPVPPTVPIHELPDDKMTKVDVSWPGNSKMPPPYSSLDEAKGGKYSYRIYLPPGYYDHPDFRYPALFIMSPDGYAKMGPMEKRAKEEGWIVVMFDQAKNGPWGPIYGNMLATHADILRRGIRIQDGLKFATGFSGGARGTSIFTQYCPGFNGELLQGAGFAFDDDGFLVRGLPHEGPYSVFMVVGLKDGNRSEIERMRQALPSRIPFKVVTHGGVHMPAPWPLFHEGLDWLVGQSLAKGNPDRDLSATGRRLFAAMAARWEAETDPARKTDEAKTLAAAGENLNFSPISAEAAELKKIKDAAQ